MKKIFAIIALALVSLFGLASCGKDNGVEVYKLETVFGAAEYNNMVKTLYLLDNDNYCITVRSTDSQNPDQVTADFYMVGVYTREGDQVTIEMGAGHFLAYQGTQVALDLDFTALTGVGFYNMTVGETFVLTVTEAGELIIPVSE